MELKYKSWDDVPISVYNRIVEVTEDETASDMEQNLSVLAILCEVSEEGIYSLPVAEVKNLLKQIDWLNDFDFDKTFDRKKVKINNRTYKVMTDLNRMTVAQYMDFQNFWHSENRNRVMGNILACICIPEGKNYAEDYDAIEVAKELYDHCPITLYNSLLFFSLNEWLLSTLATKIYYSWEMKRRIRKTKDKQEKEMLMQKLKELESMTVDMDGYASSRK